jgi:DNA-binding beta-propeller fold protein YncE
MALRRLPAIFAPVLIASTTFAQSFVNWETPHVHPLDITPDGSRLLAVNTADNRLEVFDITTGRAAHSAFASVGLDPVSVRARSDAEAWVVNHISDSVSIVDLTTLNVVVTLRTDDEPCDVVFCAGRAFVSCSQANTVLVFDLANMSQPPTRLSIEGEDPRAMAVNPARNEVYVAIFESGNDTTILGGGSTMNSGFPPNVVDDPLSPYFNNAQAFNLGVNPPNPPPNDGVNFKPAKNIANPAAPRVGMIVRKNAAAQWMDDNSHNWTHLVTGANAANSGRLPGWDLVDHDAAIINASSLSVGYATGLMNLCMAIAVNPGNEQITVVGTDATNEVRFEPVVQGRFIHVNVARVNPVGPASIGVTDLNPHLASSYGTTIPFAPIPQSDRNKSLGDPRGIVWNAAGSRGYVAGMGSNNVIVIDGNGDRLPLQDPVSVGEGPTGLAFDEARGRLYVINKFAATISTIDTTSLMEQLPRSSIHDPTTLAIKTGRKHLYDTHRNSGLGQIACASCHIDARMDRLAWELGNPAGSMKTFNAFAGTACPSGDCQNCPAGNCQSWHPMKGPMTTQTLQNIIGLEPLHWRGDRDGLEEFAGAFPGLQGADGALPPTEMQEFENFLASIYYPPNPFRNFDNSLPTSLPLSGHFTTGRFAPAGQPLPNGNAVNGLTAYRTAGLDGVNCVTCHTLPTGAGTDTALVLPNFVPIPVGPKGEHHLALVSVDGSTNVSMKIPHLRNQYEKTGFELTQLRNRSGFGLLHDGSVDSIARFINEPVFSVTSDQQTADLVALMLAFSGSGYPPRTAQEPPGLASQDSHAAVGWQTTLVDAANPAPGQLSLISGMIGLANANAVGLVVKGRPGGVQRGYRYNGANLFQSDRLAETMTAAALQAAAVPGSELTYTVVPEGSETRIGIDRDSDGFLDRDELDACSDPANAASVPGNPSVDIDADGDEDMADVDVFVGALLGVNVNFDHVARSDLNCDGTDNGLDIVPFAHAFLTP